jgi:hypothetical protein
MKAIKAIERLLRQDIPWIDGQPSATEVERASEDRLRPNGRHRRGSRSNRNKGGGAHGASQPRLEGQRQGHAGREGHKANAKPQPQHTQHRRDHQQPKAAQGKPAHNSAPKGGNSHTHSHHTSAPKPPQAQPSGHRSPPPKAPQPSRGGVRGMGEHVPAFMTRSVRPLD